MSTRDEEDISVSRSAFNREPRTTSRIDFHRGYIAALAKVERAEKRAAADELDSTTSLLVYLGLASGPLIAQLRDRAATLRAEADQ